MESLSEIRVVDPVVTTLARGYRNAAFIFAMLFPYALVAQRAGKIIEFHADDFVKRNVVRAPGGARQRVTVGHEGKPYATVQKALDGEVPVEHQEEAEAVLMIDMGQRASNSVMANVGLQIELAAADLATDSANYDPTHVETLAGASKWDAAGSDPADAVENAKQKVAGAIAQKPNTLVIGSEVYSRLRNAPAVIERIKYVRGPEAQVTQDTLKAYFDVEHFAVGEARHGEPGAFVPAWGKFAVLAYTNTASLAQGMMDRGEPSFGYTYRLNGYPMAEMPWYDRTCGAWVYPMTSEDTPVIAGRDAGYLFKDVVD